ncbi:MAG TPA: hypothetical protein VF137_04530 [Candidatus Dormibacteraeota bacterium]
MSTPATPAAGDPVAFSATSDAAPVSSLQAWRLPALVAVVAIAIVGALGALYASAAKDRTSLQAQLASQRAQLVLAKSSLNSTQAELSTARAQLPLQQQAWHYKDRVLTDLAAISTAMDAFLKDCTGASAEAACEGDLHAVQAAVRAATSAHQGLSFPAADQASESDLLQAYKEADNGISATFAASSAGNLNGVSSGLTALGNALQAMVRADKAIAAT